MSKTDKKSMKAGWLVLIIVMALVDLALFIRYQLQGKNIAILNPKGLIAEQQQELIVFTVAVLLIIAIPSLFLVYFTAWKYRESNPKTPKPSHKRHGKYLVATMWLIPTIVFVVLVSVMWPSTHLLVPQKQITSDVKPMTIQVISLRWKWLFIYPKQQIATVNFVQIPVDTPVTFEMTADEAPMSSFWIPNLGGQLYTMTSHVNRLNLMADTLGDFPGSSAEINGAGFAGMKFTARSSSMDDFNLWVAETKQSPDVLDSAMYDSLLKPSERNPVAFYSDYDNNLYDKVIIKYLGSAGSHH